MSRRRGEGSGGGVEVRSAQSGDLDDFLAVLCEAFGLPNGPARRLFYDDPYFDINLKRVLVVDGRVVSCLTIVPVEMRVGAAVVRMGGIAGVATLESDRGRGYGTQIVQETVADLSRMGFAVAGLMAAEQGFYDRMGWDGCGGAYRLRVPRAQLPPYRDADLVRDGTPADGLALARLHAPVWAARTGAFRRDHARWKYILRQVRICAVYERDGVVGGYLLGDVGNDPDLGRRLHAMEILAADDAARRGLVGYLARQVDVDVVEYSAGWEEIGLSGLASFLPVPAAEPPVVSPVPGLMVRLTDFAGAIASIAPNLAGVRGVFQLAADDPHGEASGVVTLSGERDGVRVTVGAGASGRNDVWGLAAGWAGLLIGGRSLEDCLARGLLQAQPAAAAALAPLFPLRVPSVSPPDYF